MISKGDDFPIHQLPAPVAEVGTERNFYDRYFFNGYSEDGSIFFGAAFCGFLSRIIRSHWNDTEKIGACLPNFILVRVLHEQVSRPPSLPDPPGWRT